MSDDLSGYVRNFARDIRPGTIPDDHGLKIFEDKISTKRYTLTRIERALASMITGQDNSVLSIKTPPYIRVLGFNTEGKYCLKIMGKCARLPILSNASDALELYSSNPRLKTQFELDLLANDIYASYTSMEQGYEWKLPPVKVK
jgi:hypothetical protein